MKNKNRELFNEAIANAKTIKDMAIVNAKQAIAESFTPQIHKMLATKLEEMEQEELEENKEEISEVEANNESEIDEAKKKAKGEESEESEESTNENVNLDELLAELNEDEVNEEELNEELEVEAKKTDDKKDDKASKKDDEDEEIDFESMSETDLEDFIKGVIKDMAASGELEDGNESEEEVEDEEEVSIDEILKSLSEEEVKEGGSTHKPVDKKAVDAKSVEYYEKAHEKVKEELGEAIETINELKKTLNEVNLLNAKLLFTNKIFKAKNLNEAQKLNVLKSFDKAKSVKESKVVYDLLLENLNEKKQQPIREHKSIASSVISGAQKTGKKPIVESVDPQIARFQRLAGISKEK
jgi:hypothetical protein